jgi:uncharacterized membrane protein YfcA
MYLIAALIGALIGARTARKRKGSILDVAFYATGYSIAFALVTLILTLITHRNFL